MAIAGARKLVGADLKVGPYLDRPSGRLRHGAYNPDIIAGELTEVTEETVFTGATEETETNGEHSDGSGGPKPGDASVTALRAASIECRRDHKRIRDFKGLVITPALDRYEPAKGRLHRCVDRPPFVSVSPFLRSSCKTVTSVTSEISKNGHADTEDLHEDR